VTPTAAAARPLARTIEGVRVLAVAGVGTGVIVGGIGGRLAMLVLRLTSPDTVRGVESDDGFTIGRFTLSGTYSLMMIGAVVGVIGAAVYRLVRPWLLGPGWFRLTTLALGAGAVVGSMLVHADGIDFRLLTPTWLAIALFVLLPAVFAVTVATAVNHVEDPSSWTRRGRMAYVLPVVMVAAFPLSIFPLAIAAGVLIAWSSIGATGDAGRRHRVVGVTVRAAWLAIAVLGLIALINDIREIAAVT
jgi:hypothetical protein